MFLFFFFFFNLLQPWKAWLVVGWRESSRVEWLNLYNFLVSKLSTCLQLNPCPWCFDVLLSDDCLEL
ncbi:hypothetical protein IHE45_19G088300 [Dioscorea alata]|uniref:Uncharacterized protein n=1 Tax=Dioscorea alata TaxID=55571 RepID=A0ACB7TZR1_DIOAL|nr:hypothetical protein IHE45_19G088300 [Dioscorea alata]